MIYPVSWHELEAEFDAANRMPPKDNLIPSLKRFCLSDYLIIQKWIDYAKGIGDPTSELFRNLPVQYQDVWDVAHSRAKEYNQTNKIR